MSVLLEVKLPDGSWQSIGPPVTEKDPPGSFTSEPHGQREVYVFGWMAGNGPKIWRSKAGAEIEAGLARLLLSQGLTEVADLNEGVTEMTLQKLSGPRHVRFRLI